MGCWWMGSFRSPLPAAPWTAAGPARSPPPGPCFSRAAARPDQYFMGEGAPVTSPAPSLAGRRRPLPLSPGDRPQEPSTSAPRAVSTFRHAQPSWPTVPSPEPCPGHKDPRTRHSASRGHSDTPRIQMRAVQSRRRHRITGTRRTRQQAT